MSNEDEKICFGLLTETSRSFSAVIDHLPPQLRHAVAIFYLVLRALDTIEDDTSIPLEQRKDIITTFHSRLNDDSFSLEGFSTTGSQVLASFPSISREFGKLAAPYQETIRGVCREMAGGMAKYLGRGIDTLGEWDDYCYYVAGLVGFGLSSLFVGLGGENARLMDRPMWNSMGLFLQKTNIIRDYAEDLAEGRSFWPREVWGRHAPELGQLGEGGLPVLNQLIEGALTHLPDVLAYLSLLRCPRVFAFCAVPQVMALATLERCYGNPRVLSANVKISRPEALSIMRGVTDYEQARAYIYRYARRLVAKGVDNPEFVARVHTAYKPRFPLWVQPEDLVCVLLFALVLLGLTLS